MNYLNERDWLVLISSRDLKYLSTICASKDRFTTPTYTSNRQSWKLDVANISTVYMITYLSIYIILLCLSVSKKVFAPCNSKTERRVANLSTDSESEKF